jgi:hypothetical protein
MVRTFSFLFCIDIYKLSKSERNALGRFYASFPETATFVLLRAKNEALCCLQDDKLADRLAWKVLNRIFGVDGASALQEATWIFSTAKKEEFNQIAEDAANLALASVKDLEYVANLTNFDEASSRGRELAVLDPEALESIPENEKILIGAHWIKCGDLIEKHFESWAYQDRLLQAQRRINRKFFKH